MNCEIEFNLVIFHVTCLKHNVYFIPMYIGPSLESYWFGLTGRKIGCSVAELTTQFCSLKLHILCTTSQQQSRMLTLPRDQY